MSPCFPQFCGMLRAVVLHSKKIHQLTKITDSDKTHVHVHVYLLYRILSHMK